MENKNTTTLLLTTVEINSSSERESEIEVLKKSELTSIIDNLNMDKIVHEAYNEARRYSSSGYIEVDIDARDGELITSFSRSHSMTIGYFDTYINLFSIGTGDGTEDYNYPEEEIYLFAEDEHINYFNELLERNSRIKDGEEDGDILDEYEIKDAVIEKFNLDEDELLEEYFEIADAENTGWLVDYDEINKQIEELYSYEQ